MDSIAEFLEHNGPCLSSRISEWLVKEKGLTPEAARKRLSRALPPIRAYPVPLFPKRTKFMYLEDQRTSDGFYDALLRDLRSTGSVYGLALDGLLARRGAVRTRDFHAVSGAPSEPLKGQVLASSVLAKLEEATLVKEFSSDFGPVLAVSRPALGVPDIDGIQARESVELIILDGLREWARRIGAASFDQIRIRGEPTLQPIGRFAFDLAGPSYLLPLRKAGTRRPGFLVADAFSQGTLDAHHIQYFIRKVTTLASSGAGVSVLPILVAEGFTGDALTAGHAAGVILATPAALFGSKVAESLKSLTETLRRAAAYASSETPDRLVSLVSGLKEIEGRAGNLRGVLFELVCAYLVRRDAVSITMGIQATHPESGKRADIDVLKYTTQGSDCVAIECKAKEPGGSVGVEEVEHWLEQTHVMQAYLRKKNLPDDSSIGFEIWTTGTFSDDAMTLLELKKTQRKKYPIAWKDGDAVLKVALDAKEKAVADALKTHFVRHPLAKL